MADGQHPNLPADSTCQTSGYNRCSRISSVAWAFGMGRYQGFEVSSFLVEGF